MLFFLPALYVWGKGCENEPKRKCAATHGKKGGKGVKIALFLCYEGEFSLIPMAQKYKKIH